MKAVSNAELLDRLLALYWRDGVTQAKAARLVGMRRDEFVELAELRRCVLILETAVWRRYHAEFLHRFPECDPRTTRREHVHWRQCDPRMYTDDELLTPPHPGTAKQGRPTKIEVGVSPPANPRVLPRVIGQPSFDCATGWADGESAKCLEVVAGR